MLTNSVQPLRREGLGELPGIHGGCADVARLAGFHDVMQRFERLGDGHRRIPPVDLIVIDEIGAESAQAVVDLGENGAPRQARAIRARAHAAMHLGCDHDLVASDEFLDHAADDLF
jgi:hypothetical protein